MDLVTYIYDYRTLLILFGLYLFYKLGTIRFNLHLKLRHEGPPPLPFIGNFLSIYRHGIRNFDLMCLKKYGNLYPFYFGNVKLAIVSDEELLKQILIKESKCFTDRMDLGFQSKETEKMLTVLKGKDWERVRNMVSPAFTLGKLKKMSPLVRDGVSLLEKRLSEHDVDQPVDFKEYFGALTMDVIARTMFGMEIDSQRNPNNPFIVHAKELFKFSFFNPFIVLILLFPESTKIIRSFFPKKTIFGRKTMDFFISNLRKAIEEREKSTEEYNDILALMLKSKIDEDESDPNFVKSLGTKSLTKTEIMAQCFIFLIAGYETTATTLTFLAYFLGKNPEAQEEVYGEILDSIGIGGEISYEAIMNMPLLDAAVNETLRICPPAERFDRLCTQNVTLTASDKSQIKVQKGDIFTVPVYAIHMNPSIWPNPESFDLHRFDTENKKSHSQYSFMPFGMGPRNCIGMRFALFELKWAIITVLMKFKIVPCAETMEKITFKKTGFSAPSRPILLKIVKRD